MDIEEFKKLKVGDKVKIVDKKTGDYWSIGGKMDRWLGKTMTIRAIVEPGIALMLEDVWYWHAHMIDRKVVEPATIGMHIVRGNKTVVRLSNGKVGVAKCNPQDTFDVYEGLRIATARAYGKEPFADRKDIAECAEDTAGCAKVCRVKRLAEAGEYVEIVKPDDISIEAGLKKGQIRRVGIIDGARYVRLLPDDYISLVLVTPDEYVVLENYTGDEV